MTNPRRLTRIEMGNGFANRFLLAGRRSPLQILPHGGRLVMIRRLSRALREAIAAGARRQEHSAGSP